MFACSILTNNKSQMKKKKNEKNNNKHKKGKEIPLQSSDKL